MLAHVRHPFLLLVRRQDSIDFLVDFVAEGSFLVALLVFAQRLVIADGFFFRAV